MCKVECCFVCFLQMWWWWLFSLRCLVGWFPHLVLDCIVFFFLLFSHIYAAIKTVHFLLVFLAAIARHNIIYQYAGFINSNCTSSDSWNYYINWFNSLEYRRSSFDWLVLFLVIFGYFRWKFQRFVAAFWNICHMYINIAVIVSLYQCWHFQKIKILFNWLFKGNTFT